MDALPERLAGMAQANANALHTLMQTTCSAATRLAALNAETARAVLAGGSGDALFAGKGAWTPGSLPAPAQIGVEQAMRYWHAAYGIWADAQNEFAEAVCSEATALNKALGGVLEGLGYAAAGMAGDRKAG